MILSGGYPFHPFTATLGEASRAGPLVRAHFLQSGPVARYRGIMNRVWRQGGLRGALAWPALRLAEAADSLFTDTGTDVPFELENRLERRPDGSTAMTWTRIFHFRRGVRRFHAVMVYDAREGAILDTLGAGTAHQVLLHPAVTPDGAIEIVSGRQWLVFGRFRLPLPRLLTGQARIREWDLGDGSGRLGIRVTVTNPIVGLVLGYEGWLRRETPEADGPAGS